MFNRLFRTAFTLGALAFAAVPASAVVYTYGFDLTSASDSADTGTNGNSLVKTLTVAGGGSVTLTATAWNVTYNSSTQKYVVSSAYLGKYTAGLGVTSAYDDLSGSDCGAGDCGTHQIDNNGNGTNTKSYDFIQLSFTKAVTLGSIGQTAYASYGTSCSTSGTNCQTTYTLDDDFSYGTGSGATNGANLTAAQFAAMFTTNVSNSGTYCAYDSNYVCNDTRSISAANNATAQSASMNWYVAASVAANYGGDGMTDSFKLNNATVYLSPVPEPQTWGMMLAGFALIGVMMRRRGTLLAFDQAI